MPSGPLELLFLIVSRTVKIILGEKEEEDSSSKVKF